MAVSGTCSDRKSLGSTRSCQSMCVTRPANSPSSSSSTVGHREDGGRTAPPCRRPRPAARWHARYARSRRDRGCSRDVLAEKQFGLPSGELSGADELVGFHRAAAGGEDEQHRDVGGGVGEHAGGVADEDRVRGGGVDVDVVDADRVVGDAAELRRGQQVGVEACRAAGRRPRRSRRTRRRRASSRGVGSSSGTCTLPAARSELQTRFGDRGGDQEVGRRLSGPADDPLERAAISSARPGRSWNGSVRRVRRASSR